MTVASALNRKTFDGDDATTSFATTPIKFFETSDLQVYITTDSTGVTALKTEGTHYTVSGGDEDSGDVGTVSLAGGSSPHGALLSGTTLVIVRELPLLQGVDFVQNDASNAEVAEAALDRLVMNVQRLDDRLDRSLVVSDGDVSGADFTVPTPSAGLAIGWNAGGDGLANLASLGGVATTAFTETLLDDVDADAVFATLVAGMTSEPAVAVGDKFAFVDVSLTPDDGRECTLQQLFNGGNGLTADSTPDTAADYLFGYDTSASAAKKVLAALVGVPTGVRVGYVGWTAPAGWVLLCGRTMGNAASGGTERANADTEALFTLIWNSYADAQCPVSSGRGASAAADFAANKTITLPDYRGRAPAGKDNMGGTSANRLTDQSGGLDGDVMGDSGGAETHTLVAGETPAQTHTVGLSGGAGSSGTIFASEGGAAAGTVPTSSVGSDGAHNNVQPTIIETVICKL